MSRPRSLVLITVDCLRADHSGFLGYPRPTTPFLDSLAAESLIFRNTIAAGVPTYYSFPAIMAGRYPLALGRDVIGLAPGEPTLASVLHEAGYATGAFIAANPYLSARFGYAAGFEKFEDFLFSEQGTPRSGRAKPGLVTRLNASFAKLAGRLGPLGGLYDELYFRYGMWRANRTEATLDELRPYPAANILIEGAVKWLQEVAGRPFFLWLHFMDTHLPFYPGQAAQNDLGVPGVSLSRMQFLNGYWNRKGIARQRLRRYREEMIGLYDCSIRWVDAQVGQFVGALRTAGIWQNCVLALTADHGEEFLEHGDRFHSAGNLHDELTRVPLLLRLPTGAKREIEGPFSTLHLPATLLEALGVPAPPEFRGGSSLAKILDGGDGQDAAVTEGLARATNPQRAEAELHSRVLGVRERRYRIVFDFRTRHESLYDLQNDPQELRPLPAGTETIVRRRLLERCRQHMDEAEHRRDPQARMNLLLDDLRFSSGSRS